MCVCVGGGRNEGGQQRDKEKKKDQNLHSCWVAAKASAVSMLVSASWVSLTKLD